MGQLAYAPLLRWKQAERLSLRDLYPEDAERILPVVEVVPSAVDKDKLSRMPQQLSDSWPGRRMVVDGSPHALRGSGQATRVYLYLAGHTSALDTEIVPAILPQDDDTTLAAAAALSRGSEGASPCAYWPTNCIWFQVFSGGRTATRIN